jgi:phage baseplate assembly protein W
MDTLGHSLLLADGDLVMRDGRLAEVAGRDNLVQALTLRLLTPYGSDPFDTGYGLSAGEALTGPQSPRMVRELLRLEIVRTLAADPRVAEVLDVRFAPVEHTARRAWEAEVDLELVDGSRANLPARLEV